MLAQAEYFVLGQLKVRNGFITINQVLKLAILFLERQSCALGTDQLILWLCIELGQQRLVSGVQAYVLGRLFSAQASRHGNRVGSRRVDADVEAGVDAFGRLLTDDVTGAAGGDRGGAKRAQGERERKHPDFADVEILVEPSLALDDVRRVEDKVRA